MFTLLAISVYDSPPPAHLEGTYGAGIDPATEQNLQVVAALAAAVGSVLMGLKAVIDAATRLLHEYHAAPKPDASPAGPPAPVEPVASSKPPEAADQPASAEAATSKCDHVWHKFRDGYACVRCGAEPDRNGPRDRKP